MNNIKINYNRFFDNKLNIKNKNKNIFTLSEMKNNSDKNC